MHRTATARVSVAFLLLSAVRGSDAFARNSRSPTIILRAYCKACHHSQLKSM